MQSPSVDPSVCVSIELTQKPAKGWKWKRYDMTWVGDRVVVKVGLGCEGHERYHWGVGGSDPQIWTDLQRFT